MIYPLRCGTRLSSWMCLEDAPYHPIFLFFLAPRNVLSLRYTLEQSFWTSCLISANSASARLRQSVRSFNTSAVGMDRKHYLAPRLLMYRNLFFVAHVGLSSGTPNHVSAVDTAFIDLSIVLTLHAEIVWLKVLLMKKITINSCFYVTQIII